MKFQKFAQALAATSGSPKAFALAIVLIAVWAVTGPLFHYNDTWQLVINTSTTIITFLMVISDSKYSEPGQRHSSHQDR